MEIWLCLYRALPNNTAIENGFKADEHWIVSLATAAEKTAIEKNYYPTISAKVVPEVLPELFRIVKATLRQGLDSAEKIMNAGKLVKISFSMLLLIVLTDCGVNGDEMN